MNPGVNLAIGDENTLSANVISNAKSAFDL